MARKPDLSFLMADDEVFQTTLLCQIEVNLNIIRDRNPKNAKRLYRLERMRQDMEALILEYDGYLPENFMDVSEKYMKWIEVDTVSLLKNFRKCSK